MLINWNHCLRREDNNIDITSMQLRAVGIKGPVCQSWVVDWAPTNLQKV